MRNLFKFCNFFCGCVNDFAIWWAGVAVFVLVFNLQYWKTNGELLCVQWSDEVWVWGLVLVAFMGLGVWFQLQLEKELYDKSRFIEMDRRVVFWGGVLGLVLWMVEYGIYGYTGLFVFGVVYFGVRLSLTNKKRNEIAKSISEDDNSLQNWEQIVGYRELVNNQMLFKAFEKVEGNLRRIIMNRSKESRAIVVCVDANWGGGKTSLVAIVENKLLEDGANVDWLHFDPWHFGNSTELIKDFFNSLGSFVYGKYGVRLDEDMKEYVRLITPVVEKTAGVSIKDWVKEGLPLKQLKVRITSRLTSVLEYPLIVVIDDVDRMDLEEVMAVLKLVKLVGDFKGIIFVLPFSYMRVASLITNNYSIEYRDYLRKIVNRRVVLSPFSYEDMEGIFMGRMLSFDHNATNKKDTLRCIFQEWVMRINAKRMRNVWERQQTKHEKLDDAHFDARFMEFEKLFYKIFPDGDLYDAWKAGKNDESKDTRVYRTSIVNIFHRILRENYGDLDSLIKSIYDDLIKRYADNRIGILLNGFYIEIIPTLMSFESMLESAGELRRKLSQETNSGIINRLISSERFNSFLKSRDVTKIDRYIKELEKIAAYDGNVMEVGESGVELDFKKISEILSRMKPEWEGYKEKFHGEKMNSNIERSIKDWLVGEVVTPRDVVHLANRILGMGNWFQDVDW